MSALHCLALSGGKSACEGVLTRGLLFSVLNEILGPEIKVSRLDTLRHAIGATSQLHAKNSQDIFLVLEVVLFVMLVRSVC
jgi:hypothetical protein